MSEKIRRFQPGSIYDHPLVDVARLCHRLKKTISSLYFLSNTTPNPT